MSGASRARSTSASGGSVPMAPFCAPLSRRWRVSGACRRRRCATMPCSREVRVERLARERQFETTRARVAHDEARDVRRAVDALGVLGVDAGVADLRRGHRDDLPAVRGVGEHLLVAGHAGREHDLADGAAVGAEGAPCEDGAVGEHEVARSRRLTSRPSPMRVEHDRARATSVISTLPVSSRSEERACSCSSSVALAARRRPARARDRPARARRARLPRACGGVEADDARRRARERVDQAARA